MAIGWRVQTTQPALQLAKPERVMADLEPIDDATALVDDAQRMRLAGPVQPGKVVAHGQTPASCGMTGRAGSPRGSLTDWRSWLLTAALHPVARLGLPAPRGLRVSYGPSSGQPRRQSPRGHRSRCTPSTSAGDASSHRSEHGLTTAACGRSVASAGRPPPWTPLPP